MAYFAALTPAEILASDAVAVVSISLFCLFVCFVLFLFLFAFVNRCSK